ncbi:MAG: YceI family protein [Tepidiformaceae bacterium]
MTWNLDPAHSSVEFAVKHMIISSTKGRFQRYAVEATIDESNLANSQALVTIEIDSLDTRDEGRDKHLRSADFFDSANFPKMTFQTKRLQPKGGNDYEIVGDLTIRDVTKEVVLDGEVTGPVKDPWGGTRVGLSAHTKINRKDWGLNWNSVLEAGGVLIGDDVRLNIETELVKAA